MLKLVTYLAIIFLLIRGVKVFKINFTFEEPLNLEGYDGILFPYDFCEIVCISRIHTLCVRI